MDSLKNRAIVIFTDLDGTLLDHDTYEWRPAEPALRRCRELDIPIVMVSSKTRAEMEVLRGELGLSWPFVSENGGGLFFPADCPLKAPEEALPRDSGRALPLGIGYEELVGILRAVREELVLDLRGFSDMNLEEISDLTGLDKKGAYLASLREYDEPFILKGQGGMDLAVLARAAENRGARVTTGGRFFHLFGSCDKGQAVERLSSWFEQHLGPLVTVGLGDSPNDISMLQKVDIPILISSIRPAEEMEAAIPECTVSGSGGPIGWNRAVLDLLSDSTNGGKSRDV